MLRFLKNCNVQKKIYIIQINSKNHKKITEGVNGLGSNVQKKQINTRHKFGVIKKTNIFG